MSRDEVPAEVRALATTYAAKFISKDDNDFAELHSLFCAAIRAALASRPAAPATDAEGDRPDANAVADFAEFYDLPMAVAYDAIARPAPVHQAVEKVRREAAEDERDRLYAEIKEVPGFWGFDAEHWFTREQNAMLPADRQRARAGQDGGA